MKLKCEQLNIINLTKLLSHIDIKQETSRFHVLGSVNKNRYPYKNST